MTQAWVDLSAITEEPPPNGLHAATAALVRDIVQARATIAELDRNHRSESEDAQRRLDAVVHTISSLSQRMEAATGKTTFGRKVRSEGAQAALTNQATAQFWFAQAASAPLGDTRKSYEVKGRSIEDANKALDDLAKAVSTGSTKTFRGRQAREAKQAVEFVEKLIASLQVFAQTTQETNRVEAERRQANIADEVTARNAAVASQRAQVLGMIGALAPSGRVDLDLAQLTGWAGAAQLAPVTVGAVRPVPEGNPLVQGVGDVVVPLVVDIRRLKGLLLQFDSSSRQNAIGGARALLLRLLVATPPGKALFTFFDPLGLGQSVSPFLKLADHDPKLVDTQAWSSGDHLRTKLNEATSHIEHVIQKYLRGEYDNIDEFNDEAGEIAEPYRFLFIFDFPNQFDETTFHQLARVIENGPRCGVFTVILHDTGAAIPYGVSLAQIPPQLPRVHVTGTVAVSDEGTEIGTLAYGAETDPSTEDRAGQGQALIDAVVDVVGRAGRGTDERTVTFERAMHLFGEAAQKGIRQDVPVGFATIDMADTTTWWQGDAGPAIAAPLGQSGARDVAVLRFDSEIHSGALLVGRPGSGKSTLLHTYIHGLTTLYPPEELELYLIDFKEGVEFKAYAEKALPHARCVAVESEREFGLSVLHAITEEMQLRGAKIRAAGGEQTSFNSYRTTSGDRLPRILLVFDEFHVLFAESDKVGLEAAQLLETIIRQGRGFGVHVLLGSQSLSGLAALDRHVPQLLPIRLLLPSAETDAQIVLGEGNDVSRLLTRRGEAVLNAAGGAAEANVQFQTAFLTEEERVQRLDLLRWFADARGFDRRPVVFEGYAASDWQSEDPERVVTDLAAGAPGIRLRLGLPASLSGAAEIVLRRESGANVLVVTKPTHDVPIALTASIALSATLQGTSRVEVIDFTSIDEGLDEALDPLLAASAVRSTRRRRANDLLVELANEVDKRVADDEVRAPALVVVLHGIHRARDLEPGGSGFDPFGESSEPDLAETLQRILRDGPEVGVHTVLWADSVANLSRRLSMGAQRDCAHRVAGQMSKDDSIAFIDSDLAASCKPHQIVIANDDTGLAQRASTFAVPPREWMAEVVRIYQERN